MMADLNTPVARRERSRCYSAFVIRRNGKLYRTTFMYRPVGGPRRAMTEFFKTARYYGWEVIALVRIRYEDLPPNDNRKSVLVEIV